jgi:hypothetical protein
MDCTEFRELISPYIDNEITQDERNAFEQHLRQCSKCRHEYEGVRQTVELCHGLSLEDPPVHLSQMVLEKINSDKKPKFKRKIPWKALTGLAAVLIVAVMLTQTMDWIPRFGEAGSMQKSADMAAPAEAPEMAMDEMQSFKMSVADTEEQFSGQANMMALPSEPEKARMMGVMEEQRALPAPTREVERERKLIKNAQLGISVENFDETFDGIVKLTEETGGFVQTSGVYNNSKTVEQRRGHLTLRVPQAVFTDVIEKIQNLGELDNKVISGDDITKQYYDTEARLTAYEKQEQRLMEILDKAKTIDEILRVENELSRVRYEIEVLTGQVKTWDSLVGLSTIEVSITENSPSKTAINSSGFSGVWARSISGFITTMNKLIDFTASAVVAVITALPVFAILLVIGVILIKAYRRFRYHG